MMQSCSWLHAHWTWLACIEKQHFMTSTEHDTLLTEHCLDVLQYVVETRYTGEEHEVGGAAQQQILGHHERIITAPPVSLYTDSIHVRCQPGCVLQPLNTLLRLS